MTVEFVYEGTSELFEQLGEPRHVGRRRYFFSTDLFDLGWFNRFAAEQIANAGARYTPELHVTLPIAQVLVAVAREQGFDNAIRHELAEVEAPWLTFREELANLKLADVSAVCERTLASAKAMVAAFSDEQPGRFVERYQATTRDFENMSAVLRGALESLPEEKRTNSMVPTVREEFERRLRVFEYGLGDTLIAAGSVMSLATVMRFLLIQGTGGIGKTHLLCDATRHRVEAGLPTLLYLCQQIHARDPWPQVSSAERGSRSQVAMSSLVLSTPLANSRGRDRLLFSMPSTR